MVQSLPENSLVVKYIYKYIYILYTHKKTTIIEMEKDINR